MVKKKRNLFVFIFFIFLFSGLTLRLYQLRYMPFSDWDEAIYAQVAKEILQKKTLITSFNDNLWLNKPPLSHLLIAISFFIFGFSELWSRSVIVIFSFLSLIFTFLLSKKISQIVLRKKDDSFAIIATLIIAASPLFLERSTILNTDIIVLFSYLGYFYFIDNFLIKTAFLLLGVWSKSLIGFFPLFFEPLFWLNQRVSLKQAMKKTALLSFQVLLASLWYIDNFIRHGDFFLQAHFYDQIIKRVVSPIELHFGNRFYYLNKLWENFHFVNFLFVLGYLIIFLKLYQKIRKRKKAVISQSSFFYYLITLIPLFYLGFLTLGKSKIYWYLTFILSFLPLSLIPFFEKPANALKKFILVVVVIFSLFNFVKKTFLFKPLITPNDKLRLAACLKKQKPQSLAFLVDRQERSNKDVIESSKLHTATSFLYGGSPSFVFYSNKKIKFFYDPEIFQKQYQNYPLLAITDDDKDDFNINIDAFEMICEVGPWRGYLKKTP